MKRQPRTRGKEDGKESNERKEELGMWEGKKIENERVRGRRGNHGEKATRGGERRGEKSVTGGQWT